MTIFVGRVAAVDAPDWPGEPAAIDLDKNLESVTVRLDSGESCTIDAGIRQAPGYIRMLNMLRHARVPVYLETGAAGSVSRLLIPGVFQVQSIAEKPVDDRLEVDLLVSHSRDFVATTNPNYRQIVEVLREALEQRSTLLVTQEPDRAEIIDVRATDLTRASGRTGPATESSDAPAFAAVPTALTHAEAQHAFDLVNAQSCPIAFSSVTCVPFLYPDQGCWDRAHEMCRILIAGGITPMKIWSYGNRWVATRNSPVCQVAWYWHTAPLIGDGPLAEQFVIDPALFSGPATVMQWLARMPVLPPSVPDDFEITDATIYLTERVNPDGTQRHDPSYLNTIAGLNLWRWQLVRRCTIDNPPGPPYDCL